MKFQSFKKWINESFNKDSDSIEDLGISMWKPYRDILVPSSEFKENGGKLVVDRELYARNGIFKDYWIGWDKYQQIDLMKSGNWGSLSVSDTDVYVLVPAKVMYI
jgi:hypothetical protein